MKNKCNSFAAAILVGGKNSRMFGVNKAFLQINGTTIIEKLLKLLQTIFQEIIIVANNKQKIEQFNNLNLS